MGMRRWDSGQILRTIRRYHREGRDLSYASMTRIHLGLISASSHYFGSYRDAVKAAGINYDRFRRKPRWSKDRVIRVIRKAAALKLNLNWSSISVRHDEFGWAAKAAVRSRLFGKWNDALLAAGIDPQRVALYRHRSRQSILRELRFRQRQKLPLNSKSMQVQMPGLYSAAAREFGSYREALRAIGVDPAMVIQRRQWDSPAIVRELKRFECNHGVVSQATLRRFDTGLLRAVRLWFGDLPSAIKAARVQRYSFRGHRFKSEELPQVASGGRRRRTSGSER